MNEKPLVSLIITTCNRDMDVLKRAIESATDQTYENKEIIVVNDYPPYEDKIKELLKGYPEIRFISNEEQSGACISRNKGIDLSNGEYIALLDDDDEWVDTKLEKMVEAFDDETVLVYCDILAVKDGAELKSDPDRAYPQGEVLKEMLGSNFVGGCSVPVIRKSTVVECGGFDKDFKSCQDLDLWIRLAKKGTFKAVKEKLIKYTVGEMSITGSLERRMNGWKMILSKYQTEYEKYPASRKEFTSTMVREAAKRGSLGYAVNTLKKYGNSGAFLKGTAMKLLGIY